MKAGIRRAAALASLLLAAVVSCAAQTPAPEWAVQVDDYLSGLVKQNRFSGAVLVARDGRVLLSKGYGFANLELEVPNTPQTRFRLGSITKQFTAAAVLLLQEQGKLDVQDPVCKYVENCPAAWQTVTIHHLLTHTSGIPNLTAFPDYQKTMALPATLAETIARFRDKPLEFKPGETLQLQQLGLHPPGPPRRESLRQDLRRVHARELLRAARHERHGPGSPRRDHQAPRLRLQVRPRGRSSTPPTWT